MAQPVVFTSLTPAEAVVDGSRDVAALPVLTLRLGAEPGLGRAVNGGDPSEAARPVAAAMTDALGTVLPQVARLFQVRVSDRSEIIGTDVPLTLILQVSAFANGLPAAPVSYELDFSPRLPLADLTLYEFSYARQLPGEWLPKELLTYAPPAS